ncbi:MAG: STT3 domain-containing protein [archaeon]|nr:STT3 domain-containing protein [archaeon]
MDEVKPEEIHHKDKDETSKEKSDSIKFNLEFLKNKKFQIALTLVIFLVILFSSVSIRLSGLPNLIDQTTGKYIFSDPDAYYEYRVAETIVNTGDISGVDSMRNPGLNLGYTQEMLPKVLAFSYDFFHFFGSSITLDYIDALYPVVAFALSLILFFVLCWYLSKSKFFSLLATLMLAYSPSYLQRTGAGVSSHEALGIVFIFLAFLTYMFSINHYKKNWKWSISLGFFTGAALALSAFSWSGGSVFVLIIISLASLIYYLFGLKGEELEIKKKFISFNLIWVVSSVILMPLFGYSLSSMILRFFSNYGVVVPFFLIFISLDFILEKYAGKIKIVKNNYRALYSLGGTILLGIIGLFVIGKNPFELIGGIYSTLLHPFDPGRVGLTVAYYAQPYLTDLINQVGASVFWIFFAGLLFLGFEFGKNIKVKKHRVYFCLIWILSLSGILFSRISSLSKIWDGATFVSQLVYILSFLVLGFCFIWFSLKEKSPVENKIIFLTSWMMMILVSVRSAVRVMFFLAPFVFLIASFFTLKSYEYGKKAKDELLKYTFYILSFLSLILIIGFVFGNPFAGSPGAYQISSYSSSNTGPVANTDWQDAMSWARNNTPVNSVFLHWWDYGYLVQTVGNRTTVLDGGNANAYWDHLMGRYVLTTPHPETAKSFMKAHNVSYLLIDPTDLGKYSAYSSIGDDEEISDRASYLPTFLSDQSQIQETDNRTIRVYQGGFGLDSDLVIESEGREVLLPRGKAGLFAIALGIRNGTYEQPVGIFVFNNKQYTAPLRYLFISNQLIDFGSGIESTVYVYPNVVGQQFDMSGAAIYLSEKTMNSLFAKLYLMNDPNNEYPELDLIKEAGPYPFNFYYGGFRAPIRIWKVNSEEMTNIIARDEFLRPDGKYGEFDDLDFTK